MKKIDFLLKFYMSKDQKKGRLKKISKRNVSDCLKVLIQSKSKRLTKSSMRSTQKPAIYKKMKMKR